MYLILIISKFISFQYKETPEPRLADPMSLLQQPSLHLRCVRKTARHGALCFLSLKKKKKKKKKLRNK